MATKCYDAVGPERLLLSRHPPLTCWLLPEMWVEDSLPFPVRDEAWNILTLVKEASVHSEVRNCFCGS